MKIPAKVVKIYNINKLNFKIMKKTSQLFGYFNDVITGRSVRWSCENGMHVVSKYLEGDIKDMLFVRSYDTARESFYSLINYDTF